MDSSFSEPGHEGEHAAEGEHPVEGEHATEGQVQEGDQTDNAAVRRPSSQRGSLDDETDKTAAAQIAEAQVLELAESKNISLPTDWVEAAKRLSFLSPLLFVVFAYSSTFYYLSSFSFFSRKDRA